MSESRLQFFVPGKPQTAGSKTAVPMGARMGVIEAGSKESRARKRSWRGDLRVAASRALAANPGFLPERESPLSLTLVIVRKRPSVHMRSGAHAGCVKPQAIGLQPVQRPDTVKITRALEDALTGVVWADDSQIVKHHLYKAFGDQAGFLASSEGVLVSVSVVASYVGPRQAAA